MSGATPFRLKPFDGPTVRGLAGRALVLWILVRITFGLFAALLAAAIDASTSASSSIAPNLGIVLVATFLSDVDVRATRETLFLAHLGIGRRHIAAIAALVACAGEIVILLAAAALSR